MPFSYKIGGAGVPIVRLFALHRGLARGHLALVLHARVRLATGTAFEKNLKMIRDFELKAQARIWP